MSEGLLSLCLIVGKGEAKELERCLESCKGDLFDEICVTIAADDFYEDLKEVAGKYTKNVSFFKWIDDFSAARNFNFSQAHCSHIFWIDADDVIKPGDYSKIRDLKPTIKNYDLIMMQYVYAHDNQDRPVVVLPRERIVRNCDDIKWHDRIHEYLNMNSEFKMKKESSIYIHHYRTKPFDPQRNLVLLKKSYEEPNVRPRTKFYYGKELADTGNWDKATEVLEDYINTGEGFEDNLASACIKLSRYYYATKRINEAKATALKGIKFSDKYAENYVLIGDAHWEQGHKEAAIDYYEEALTKELGNAGMSQMADFYKYLPCQRLARVYLSLKDYDKALKYCRMAEEEKSEDGIVRQIKLAIDKMGSSDKSTKVLTDVSKKEIEEFLLSKSFDVEIEDNNVQYARLKLTKNISLSVAWLIPIMDLDNPSIRLRRYNIHRQLLKMGVESKIVTNYYGKSIYEIRNEIGGASVVVVTQFSTEDFEIMKYLKSLGKKLAYDHNEALFGYPMEAECFHQADVVVCCSTLLAQMTKNLKFGPVSVIKDALDSLENKPKPVYSNRYSKLKAVYMGMGGNSFLANQVLREVVERAGYDLVTITEWDNATIKWNKNTWPQDLCNCDVVLCPQRTEVQPAKSNVKVTVAMDLGLPVIVSPIESYKEVIQHRKNGYLAGNLNEWSIALEELKDPTIREKVGRAAQESVSEYTLDSIGKKWKDLCTNLILGKDLEEDTKKLDVPEVSSKARDQVDLIVANYNNVKYLKLLYNSIMLNTLYPFHLIISDAGSDEETWEFLKSLKGVTVLGRPGVRINFSEACNAGICSSKAKYFAILNSDIIVSNGWLTNIMNKMKSVDRLAACGVLSNCDRGWLHGVPGKPEYPMHLKGSNLQLIPGMKYDQISPHIEELYSFMLESNRRLKGEFSEQPWVAYYATVFARSAVNEIGLLDPKFKNGCEDLDHCQRLNKFGYKMGQSLDSFVFHFGGISRGAYQQEDKESYDKEDMRNHVICKDKWKKKNIIIFTGDAWEPWNKAKVDEGMAGSETWAAYLAQSFATKGYDVTVYNDLLCDGDEDRVIEPVKGTEFSVTYRHYSKLIEDIRYKFVHHFIASRTIEPLKNRLHCHNHYVMIHDIWLSNDRNYDILPWKVKKYACLSEWHKKFVMSHHSLPENKIFLTANGIDHDFYKNVNRYKKKNQSVYSSSPDRGLLQLLNMVPRIRKEIPDFELLVAYGFYNWEEASKKRNDGASMALIKSIKEKMKQPGVKYLGRVDKKTLAKHQMQSKVWLFPTWFSETFCIGAVENGVSNNAILSSAYAGLNTTVGDSGILLPSDNMFRDKPYPDEYVDKFVSEAIILLKDEKYRLEWASKAYDKMKGYTWDKVAEGWIKEFGDEDPYDTHIPVIEEKP